MSCVAHPVTGARDSPWELLLLEKGEINDVPCMTTVIPLTFTIRMVLESQWLLLPGKPSGEVLYFLTIHHMHLQTTKK